MGIKEKILQLNIIAFLEIQRFHKNTKFGMKILQVKSKWSIEKIEL